MSDTTRESSERVSADTTRRLTPTLSAEELLGAGAWPSLPVSGASPPQRIDTGDDMWSVAWRMGAADVALNSARWWASVRWGLGTAAAVHAAALRFGGRTAIVDDTGSLDYRSLDRAANSVASELRSVATGSDGTLGALGILCRNHRWFVTALPLEGGFRAETPQRGPQALGHTPRERNRRGFRGWDYAVGINRAREKE